jgi:catechol 2,3-dioxygenase-like lactoylglutathione lyase family enzyme
LFATPLTVAGPAAVEKDIVMPPSITDQVTWVYTADLEGTCKFYADVLGLALAVDQGASRIYRAGRTAFIGVCLVRPGRWVEPKGVVITLVTREVDAWHARLLAKGIEADAPGVSQTWGIYHFFARDPNGYVVEFQGFLNPGWSPTSSGASGS